MQGLHTSRQPKDGFAAMTTVDLAGGMHKSESFFQRPHQGVHPNVAEVPIIKKKKAIATCPIDVLHL